MTDSRAPAWLRWAVAGGLLVAAIAHLPVIPEHLREAPYMGIAFVAFTVAAVTLAMLVAVRPSVVVYRIAGMLCASALAAYLLTRLIAFPQVADDVGNWTETPGLVAITTEFLVIALSASASRWIGRPTARNERYEVTVSRRTLPVG